MTRSMPTAVDVTRARIAADASGLKSVGSGNSPAFDPLATRIASPSTNIVETITSDHVCIFFTKSPFLRSYESPRYYFPIKYSGDESSMNRQRFVANINEEEGTSEKTASMIVG